MCAKILITGANGYIGKRLIPQLIFEGHELICCVRDKKRFFIPEKIKKTVKTIEVDFLKKETLNNIPKNIDMAFYLVHSMSYQNNFVPFEKKCAEHFTEAISKTKAKQVIYLSGIVNDDKLSKHLESRKTVENILNSGSFHTTTLRAGIIIGSGSASFEIIRDLCEKLPLMVTPKWLNTKCQPIGIREVLSFMKKSILNKEVYDVSFDIGGSSVLSYKDMLLGYADVRGLKRWIFTLPIMTPKLSSYWLFFVTSTTYRLASSLVDSMKVEVICKPNNYHEILGVDKVNYKTSLERTFLKIEANEVLSSWKDSMISGRLNKKITAYIDVPTFGCFKDRKMRMIKNKKETIQRIWSIGGKNGWYFATFLWKIRGLIDKAFGGVGLRRGRTLPDDINTGDAIDFWRVLYANKSEGRLLLYAEMKLPGEAWLDFKIRNNKVYQVATFRPYGIKGRLYWYAMLPFHFFIFNGMLNKIANI